MINKIENEKKTGVSTKEDMSRVDQVSPLVVAKICLNIAIIRSQMGYYQEAVFMHEKSLEYKSKILP